MVSAFYFLIYFKTVTKNLLRIQQRNWHGMYMSYDTGKTRTG